MSFIGTPTFELVTPTLARLTGVSLPANTSALLGLPQATGLPTPDLLLPVDFEVDDTGVSLRAALQVRITPESALGLTNLPPSVHKTGGTKETFRILITNTKVDLQTQDLEIYFEFVAEQPDDL